VSAGSGTIYDNTPDSDKSVDLAHAVVKEMGCLMTGETPHVCGSMILGRYQDEKQHVPEVGWELGTVVSL
jgi:hypothetical protein